MSHRPNIQSDRERAVERRIQADRARRQSRRAQGASRARPGQNDTPVCTCTGRGPSGQPIPPDVQRWIDQHARAQLTHYRAIVAEMDRIEPEREAWVQAFFARITGPRGFSVHAGQRRTIRPEELEARPVRRWRVVW